MRDSTKAQLDWTAQLVMLRGMTERFGSLHEAQKLQLQLWPFTVDPSIVSSKANVEMETKVVEFSWGGSTMKVGPKYLERLKTLNENVKFLLGDDWSTIVVSNGVSIYPLTIDTKNGKQQKAYGRKRRNSKTKRKRTRR